MKETLYILFALILIAISTSIIYCSDDTYVRSNNIVVTFPESIAISITPKSTSFLESIRPDAEDDNVYIPLINVITSSTIDVGIYHVELNAYSSETLYGTSYVFKLKSIETDIDISNSRIGFDYKNGKLIKDSQFSNMYDYVFRHNREYINVEWTDVDGVQQSKEILLPDVVVENKGGIGNKICQNYEMDTYFPSPNGVFDESNYRKYRLTDIKLSMTNTRGYAGYGAYKDLDPDSYYKCSFNSGRLTKHTCDTGKVYTGDGICSVLDTEARMCLSSDDGTYRGIYSERGNYYIKCMPTWPFFEKVECSGRSVFDVDLGKCTEDDICSGLGNITLRDSERKHDQETYIQCIDGKSVVRDCKLYGSRLAYNNTACMDTECLAFNDGDGHIPVLIDNPFDTLNLKTINVNTLKCHDGFVMNRDKNEVITFVKLTEPLIKAHLKGSAYTPTILSKMYIEYYAPTKYFDVAINKWIEVHSFRDLPTSYFSTSKIRVRSPDIDIDIPYIRYSLYIDILQNHNKHINDDLELDMTSDNKPMVLYDSEVLHISDTDYYTCSFINKYRLYKYHSKTKTFIPADAEFPQLIGPLGYVTRGSKASVAVTELGVIQLPSAIEFKTFTTLYRSENENIFGYKFVNVRENVYKKSVDDDNAYIKYNIPTYYYPTNNIGAQSRLIKTESFRDLPDFFTELRVFSKFTTKNTMPLKCIYHSLYINITSNVGTLIDIDDLNVDIIATPKVLSSMELTDLLEYCSDVDNNEYICCSYVNKQSLYRFDLPTKSFVDITLTYPTIHKPMGYMTNCGYHIKRNVISIFNVVEDITNNNLLLESGENPFGYIFSTIVNNHHRTPKKISKVDVNCNRPNAEYLLDTYFTSVDGMSICMNGKVKGRIHDMPCSSICGFTVNKSLLTCDQFKEYPTVWLDNGMNISLKAPLKILSYNGMYGKTNTMRSST